MISNKYKVLLQKEAKQIDSAFGSDSRFQTLVREITEEKNERSYLEFMNEVNLLSKAPGEKIKSEKEEKLYELLYTFIGSVVIEDAFSKLKDQSNVSLEDLLGELYNLIGLENVKSQVKHLISFNKIQKLRVDNGLKTSDKTLHMAFLGNPGTGKTTVARIIGKMYKSIGLLSKGHFIEASRTDLIAEYQGQTAVKVKRLITRAFGGVLFIDEAYSITENEQSDSYGRECLTELTKALEDYRSDLVVIVAGYTELMEQFFNSNPGLKSRFNTFVMFNDYDLDELVGIFQQLCKINDYYITNTAMVKVNEWFNKKLDAKDDSFSNGRFVRNLFDDIVMNQAVRLSDMETILTKELLQTIEECDIPVTSIAELGDC